MRLVYAGNTQWQGTTETPSQVGGGFTRVCLTVCILVFSPQETFNTQSAVTGSSVTPLEGCASLLACLVEGGVDEKPTDGAGELCSFTSETVVSTDHGQRAIGKVHAGEEVLAYNPQTHKMELQPILHVWIHPDHDLIDLKITTTILSHQGKPAKQADEVVHTTSKHPFLTTEQGFLPAGKIRVGMHVLRADGSLGVISGWKVVPGTKVMYNLEVAHDHTFTVGNGQWVVHNCSALPPVPDDVLGLADRTDDVRTASNTRRMVPGGPKTPNIASANIDVTQDGNLIDRLTGDFKSRGFFEHSEYRAVQWAQGELPGLVAKYGSDTTYTLKMVTQYGPCSAAYGSFGCGDFIASGVWENMLDAAAGQPVNFEVWHYPDSGPPYLWFSNH